MLATVTGCEGKKHIRKTKVMTKLILQDASWSCLQGGVIASWQ